MIPAPFPKIGLALGGGTTLGIAHVGVLTALAERAVPVSMVSGTSAGALVASCFAFGIPVSRMGEIARSLDWKKLSRFGKSFLGWHSNAPMSTFLTNLLGAVCIEDAQVPLAIVATDIETYQKVVLKKGLVSEAVRASTCIPGLFAPVEVEGKLLVDGGLSENVPLSPLRAMGADIVIGVNLTAYQKAMRPRNFFHIINNTYTTLSQHRDRTLHEDADILIEPDLTEFDPMRFERAEDMFAVGYHAMCDALPKLEEKITSYKKENGGVWRTVWHTLTRPLF